jgi:hypothetical protein
MIYSFYYRVKPRTSLAEIGRVEAGTKEEAARLARTAVTQAHPEGFVMGVCLAKNSPLPVKNADGKTCTPAQVY